MPPRDSSTLGRVRVGGRVRGKGRGGGRGRALLVNSSTLVSVQGRDRVIRLGLKLIHCSTLLRVRGRDRAIVS